MKQPSPFDLIRRYFSVRASLPDADDIAAPEILMLSARALIRAVAALKIVPLSEADRRSLRGKDPAMQRALSRAVLQVLRQRPALARRVAVDPDTLAAVLARDAAMDLLYDVLEQVAQLYKDGLLQVRAALSQGSRAVQDRVEALLQDPDTDADLASQLRVFFGAVALSVREHAERRSDRAQRKERKQHPEEGG